MDFPDIDVVVQYDAPTDPKTFSHRAGRTARAGRRGKAVLLLGKGREEDYVGMFQSTKPGIEEKSSNSILDFLNIRKIPLTKQPYISASLEEVDTPQILDPEATTLLHSIRQIILIDRELSDKAAKSFVSSFRAYSKHEASFIFRTLDFDFNSQAISFGLLRLPAMPEIKDWKKKKEAERQRLERIKSEGGEVEEREVIEWEDAEVNVNFLPFLSLLHIQRMLILFAKVGYFRLRIKTTRSLSSRDPRSKS